MTTRTANGSSILPSPERREKLRKWRGFKDHGTKYGVAFGGFSVIGALALIFIFLFIEVLPIFRPATMEFKAQHSVAATSGAEVLLTSVDRYLEVGVSFDRSGRVLFLNPTKVGLSWMNRSPLAPGNRSPALPMPRSAPVWWPLVWIMARRWW